MTIEQFLSPAIAKLLQAKEQLSLVQDILQL